MHTEIINKYNVPVPRYTSYPPANYFVAIYQRPLPGGCTAVESGFRARIIVLPAYPVLSALMPLLRMQFVSHGTSRDY